MSDPVGDEPLEAQTDEGAPDGPVEDNESDEADEPEEWTVDAPPGRRRAAPLLLLAGLVIAFAVGRHALPTTRTVVLRLEGDRAEVRSVELSVGRVADADDDFSSTQWRYEANSPPPPVLRKELKLVSGQHRFRVAVVREREEQAQTTRVVDVSDEEVTIRVPTH